MTGILIIRGKFVNTHTHEMPCEGLEYGYRRDWNYAITSQGMPGAARSWERKEESFLP